MTKLRYYSSQTLEQLRSSVAERLDWYYAPERPHSTFSFSGERESKLKAPALSEKLAMDEERPSSTDVQNALTVYRALADLTPHQASIERMWVHLCHCDCFRYVSERWLRTRPEREEDAVRKVQNHFFAQGNRALIRDNGVSRLWWLGRIAYDAAPSSPREFLDILLHRQDVRSALIERPAVSMNRRVLKAIYMVMRESWHNGRTLFQREIFRTWMTSLNRRGGVVLLDALPDESLGKLLREEADNALEKNTGPEAERYGR